MGAIRPLKYKKLLGFNPSVPGILKNPASTNLGTSLCLGAIRPLENEKLLGLNPSIPGVLPLRIGRDRDGVKRPGDERPDVDQGHPQAQRRGLCF